MTEGFFKMASAIDAFIHETPIGRMPTVQDVAYSALYLASDRCIATGDLIRVSGGAHTRRIPTYSEMGLWGITLDEKQDVSLENDWIDNSKVPYPKLGSEPITGDRYFSKEFMEKEWDKL